MAAGKHYLLSLVVMVLVILLGACAPRTEPGDNTFAEAEIGAVVMSGAVDSANSPTDIRTVFDRSEAVIYAVFDVKRIDAGTTLYVIWRSPGNEFEEPSSPLTADRLYENVFVEFHLEPVQGSTLEALQPGDYEVQMYVNDKAGPKAAFTLIAEE